MYQSHYQKLINVLYRFPKSRFRTYKRFGGYFNYRQMLKGSRQMGAAVFKLPVSMSYPDGLPIYFLTGKKYLHQTLFCINSLTKTSKEKYKFVIVDDGSFTEDNCRLLSAKLPDATFISANQVSKNIAEYLPSDKYPVLNYKRKVYPHLKKLTDIHTIDPVGWKLVLDSDMLFWEEPGEILRWLKKPLQPIHMVDCTESYGYTKNHMEALCGTKLPALLNVGVIGLNSGEINWCNLENWISELEAIEGTSYYLEQALTAMLVAGKESVVLDRNKYRVNPTHLDFEAKADILHHYVDLSRAIYFNKAWKLNL